MTNLEYAQGLRALADFYESNPTASRQERIYVFLNDRESFLNMVKMMAKGGRVEKKAGDPRDDYSNYTAERAFGDVTLRVNIPQKLVCKLVSAAVYDCPDSLLEAAGEYSKDEPELADQETAEGLAAIAKESIEAAQ